MATITTKYSIGDEVWHATTHMETKRHPCPDCLGEGRWKAISPAGTEYSFGCPRCVASYTSYNNISLKYAAYAPSARRLTIGSVRYNSNPHSSESGTEYMCHETGVGSGSVYYENKLFETEEEALAAAQLMANNANSTTDWVVKLYDRTLEISDYQLEHAVLKDAADADSRARSMLYNLSDLFEAIGNADDKDAILEAVDEYKKYDWARDNEKLAPELAA